MAGIFTRGEFTHDIIEYFAIESSKSPSTLTKDFLLTLGSLADYSNPNYYNLEAVALYENCLLQYVQHLNPEFSDDDIIAFFRGSSQLPNETGFPEEDTWIIEPSSVEKLLFYIPQINIDLFKQYIPPEYYERVEIRKNLLVRQKVSLKYFPVTFKEQQAQFLDTLIEVLEFLSSHIQNNLIILCKWDQS